MRSIKRIAIALSMLSIAIGLSGCVNSSIKSLFKNQSMASAESIPLTIWHESFESALEESNATGKPILADFTGSDWCHWCVKLKEDVFETESFKAWADENVVLLELDYPKRGMQSPEIKAQNTELAQRYGIQSYPTVLLLSGSGDVIGKLGYLDNPESWISAAESHLSQQSNTFLQ